MKQTVLCIPDQQINPQSLGLISVKNWEDLTNVLGENIWAVPRSIAEVTLVLRQVIPYVTLVSDDGRILAYQRGKAGNEDRLHDLWSIGIGGHVEITDLTEEDLTGKLSNGDLQPASSCWDFLAGAADREIVEELPNAWLDDDAMVLGGVIRLSDTEVDSVHVGVWIIAVVSSEEAEELLEDTEVALQNPQWMTEAELKTVQLENWSALVFKELAVKLRTCGCGNPSCGCKDQACCDDDAA